MLGIGSFFKKIQNAYSKEFFLRTAVQQALKKYVTIEIPLGNIDCSTGIVNLKAISQALRSQIFIKKTLIIQEINRVQDMRKVSDIR